MVGQFATRFPLARAVYDQFLGLKPHPTLCQATYIWIDGSGETMRSKTRTLEEAPKKAEDYPNWNHDGSSTGFAVGKNSDTHLKPVAHYPDPLLGGQNRLVLCETYDFANKATKTNNRSRAKSVLDKIAHLKPWYGFEQEYLFLDRDGHPLGWPKNGFPGPQGPYYCGVGAERAFGREVVEAHYRACLQAGICLGGTNAEVTPGQWEFQIGPIEGIQGCDDMWMARYLLYRVAEAFGIAVTLHPKPAITMGDWNGAGCHTNFSIETMRADGGLKVIEDAMPKLAAKHHEHLKQYDPHGGVDNAVRLSGRHETSSADKFTYGVANRTVSVRIPRAVAENGKGFLEDRRPSSNVDPYTAAACIAEAICLD